MTHRRPPETGRQVKFSACNLIQHFPTEHMKQIVTENPNPLFHKMTRTSWKLFCVIYP